MDVSIIIISFNTRILLSNCLITIIEKTNGLHYEVIIVDNASRDDSVSYIKKNFPAIKLICLQENLGFGKANNIGATIAKGKYLFFLNPDTLLTNNAVKIFYDYMEKCHISIGALGGILIDKNGQETYSYNEFPSIYSETKYIWKKFTHQNTIPPSKDHIQSVDFIVGADLFISKKIFCKVNGFDPNFFMYYEETDLQKRMDIQNLKRIILPQVRIIHLDGGSFDGMGFTYNRFSLSQKSMNYYVSKHFHGIYYFLFRTTMAILRLSLFSARLTKKWTWKERLLGYAQVLQ